MFCQTLVQAQAQLRSDHLSKQYVSNFYLVSRQGGLYKWSCCVSCYNVISPNMLLLCASRAVHPPSWSPAPGESKLHFLKRVTTEGHTIVDAFLTVSAAQIGQATAL